MVRMSVSDVFPYTGQTDRDYLTEVEKDDWAKVERACDIPITQTELADAAGLSTVHVNRNLQSLRKNGLISFRAGSLKVLDWAGLVEAGAFDPAYLHISAAAYPR
jgi:CRP-like cAMP-binding protein